MIKYFQSTKTSKLGNLRNRQKCKVTDCVVAVCSHHAITTRMLLHSVGLDHCSAKLRGGDGRQTGRQRMLLTYAYRRRHESSGLGFCQCARWCCGGTSHAPSNPASRSDDRSLFLNFRDGGQSSLA